MKKIISIFITIAMVLGICSCGAEKAQSDKLQVYTSFYAMNDFAKLIAGDAADVHLLCPPGGEPHDYEPTTADMAKLTEADVFIYNGGGMEHWAEKIAGMLEGVKVVCASDNLIKPGLNDPHVWLNPENALAEMEKIHDALVEADAENAEIYRQNYANCAGMIAELEIMYHDTLLAAQKSAIVVAHGAYSYLCDVYGIEQLAIENLSGDSDPSPAAMAEIIDKAKEKGIKYVCAEEMNSSKVVETVAKELGAEVVTLNPFESSADSKGYFEVMYENLETLKKVLS